MVNYQLGKIYKVVCHTTGEVYIGSTCEPTLARRLANHRHSYKNFYDNHIGFYLSIFQILERGSYYIDLLEAYPCNSNDDLRKKEREWYDKIECINLNRPYLSHDENLRLKKVYRDTNRDFISNYNKQYIAENREKLNALKRMKYKENKIQKTEEEILALKLKRQEFAKSMRERHLKKVAEKRLDPNYEEEKKEKQREAWRKRYRKQAETKKAEMKNTL